MFDALAPRYDAFNRWASLGQDEGWRRRAIRALELERGDLVLDIATGTGDLAFAAARDGAEVIGCDFAPEMIRLAASKSDELGAAARFHVADAARLPYRSGLFDGVVSAFAMRNVRPVLDEVLEEGLRALRPGGRIVILEFSRPTSSLVAWGHRIYTRELMPRIGKLLAGDAEPFEYLSRSIEDWERPEEFAERLGRIGFVEVAFERLSMGTVALHRGQKPAG